MIHMKKKSLLLILTIFALCTLTACGSNPKNFTSGDLTVTLTSDFTQSKMNEFDLYLTSDLVSFTAKEESVNDLEHAGFEITSLKGYALEIAALNKQNPDTLVDRGSYLYFIDTKENQGAKYTYIHCMFKGSASYWICEFVCKSSDYDKLKKDIFAWADSITIK